MGQAVQNFVGRGLYAANTIAAVRSGQLSHQAASTASSLNDPAVRAGLVNSPFSSGAMGMGGQQRALPTVPSLDPNQVNVPQSFSWQPNLPPLNPSTGLKEAQAQAGLDVAATDPNLAAAQWGIASPEQIGSIIARNPGANPNQPGSGAIGNFVESTNGLSMGSSPIPWNLLYRGNESQQSGGPGFNGLPTGNTYRGPAPLGQSTAPAPFAVRLPAGASPADYIAALEGVGVLQPGQGSVGGVPQQPNASPGSAAPPMPPAPQAQGSPPGNVSPTLPQGFTPFDASKLGVVPLGQPAEQPAGGQAQVPAPPSGGTVGYPSPATDGSLPSPTAGPQGSMNPRQVTQDSYTVPYGSFGSHTSKVTNINPQQQWEDSVRRQQAKGITDPLATRVDVLTIADNAFSEMLQKYAPGGDFSVMARYVGPGTYTAQKTLSRTPFVDSATRKLNEAVGRGEQSTSSGRFRALLEGLGIPARAFAGAAFTETEKQLYGPTFIPKGELPLDEFKGYLTNYGRAIRDLSRTTILNHPALAPETKARLAQIVQNYEAW